VIEPELVEIPVVGGGLRAGVWGPGGPVVVLVHGITASHVVWRAVARYLADITFFAPDLRGRGGSARLPGPFGLAAHVRDVLVALDFFGVAKVVAAGHSMGAHIVADLAAAFPERVHSIVLVDGGLPLPLRRNANPDELLASLLGPALARLRRSFRSREEYFAFWREHPAFAETGCWNEHVEAYLDYDLTGSAPGFRSRVSEEAVSTDGRDVLLSPSLRARLASVGCPVALLRSPRGLLNQPSPLIPDGVVADWRAILPQLTEQVIPGTNHYTILLGDTGSRRVAEHILEAAAAS
jgi:lipase